MTDPNHLITQVGKRITVLRLERHLKQVELAEKLNMEPRGLRRIEAGDTNPTLKTLCLIANALDMTVSELVDVE